MLEEIRESCWLRTGLIATPDLSEGLREDFLYLFLNCSFHASFCSISLLPIACFRKREFFRESISILERGIFEFLRNAIEFSFECAEKRLRCSTRDDAIDDCELDVHTLLSSESFSIRCLPGIKLRIDDSIQKFWCSFHQIRLCSFKKR